MRLLLLALIPLAACAPSASSPTDIPACLYELRARDGGARFEVQSFPTLPDCRAYERLCNALPWPIDQTPRCTPCCDYCSL